MKIELTDSEWISLLDGNAEDSGLPICCANISALRDQLVSIVRDGRNSDIMKWEIDDLKQKIKWVIDGHDIEGLPLIKKIADQIGFDFETVEHEPQTLEL